MRLIPSLALYSSRREINRSSPASGTPLRVVVPRWPGQRHPSPPPANNPRWRGPGRCVPRPGSGSPAKASPEARRGHRRFVELGEVGGERLVVEPAAVEPGVEPAERPGVRQNLRSPSRDRSRTGSRRGTRYPDHARRFRASPQRHGDALADIAPDLTANLGRDGTQAAWSRT